MRALAVIGLIIAATIGSCIVLYPRATVYYRLTLEVETPEGMKTGSVVNRLGFSLEPQIGTRGYNWGLTSGEAVAVDLGSAGTLYALLVGRSKKDGAPEQGLDPAMLVMQVLAPELWRGPKDRSFIEGMRTLSARADVPLKHIPFLVRFRDEKDPKSVEAVDPANLAASFGPGVALKRVTIETVSSGVWPLNLFGIGGEPVTRGIEGRLGWLSSVPEPNLDPGGPAVGGPQVTAPLRRLLSHGDFRRTS